MICNTFETIIHTDNCGNHFCVVKPVSWIIVQINTLPQTDANKILTRLMYTEAHRKAAVLYDTHYSDVIMGLMEFQITSLMIVYSAICSSPDQRKSSTSLAFVWWIHWWPVNSLHKWPVMWKMFHLIKPSHYPNQCWVIVNWTLRNKLQWNFNHW